MITRINPYLRMDGKAEQAIKLYQSALGAKIEQMLRFAEMPGPGVPPEHKNRVMHSVLSLGTVTLMLQDTMPGTSTQPGDNVQVCLEYSDVPEMTRAFNALAVGGKVCRGLEDAFFGAKFGIITDAFGISWIFVGPILQR